MYSKAKLFGHPIHPMLVAFPIAFYTASFVGYWAFHFTNLEPFWFDVAYVANVAGVITAILAAVPGFIDWAFGVPTGSPAKATGLLHMLCNVIALVLFTVSAFLNRDQLQSTNPHALPGVILSALGILFTGMAAFLGWKMVATHHVGVELNPEQQRFEKTARESALKGTAK